MARPPSRSGLTPAEALAAARAAAEARNPGDLSVAVAVRASEGVIAARERAAAWGKRLLRSIWTPVDPYDGDQVAEFAATAARHMATAQKTTATAAAAGQIQLLSSMGVRVAVRPDVPVDVRAPGATFDDGRVELDHSATWVRYRDQDPVDLDAAGMTTVEVFNRPARTVRYLESKGATREQAEVEALKRLDALVDGNMMLAQRLAESQVINAAANLRGSTVVGMRRIIHPELSRTGTCGLCIAASDRLYTVRELLPIHANCKCTSAAVTEEFDPADELNAVDLRQLYRDAGGTSAAHLKRTRYKEDVHGELGPVVIPVRKYKPRSKASEKAAGGTAVMAEETKVEIARRHLPLLEGNLTKLREQGLAEDSSQVKYHKQQIERYRATLAEQGAHEGTVSGEGARTPIRVTPSENDESSTRQADKGNSGNGNGNGPGGGGPGSGGGESSGPYPLPTGQRVEAEPGGRRIFDRRTYSDLVRVGAVAPLEDPYRFFDRDNKRRGKHGRPEESIADWLMGKGVKLRSVDENTPMIQGKIPDSVIDRDQVTAEIKTIDPLTQEQSDAGLASRRVNSAIRAAGQQSPYAVIDARKVLAHPEQIVAGIRSAIHHRGAALMQVIVVLSDDLHLEWRA